MKHLRRPIWFASGSRLRGMFRWFLRQDTGILLIEPGLISFDAAMFQLRIRDVESIELAIRMPPLPYYLFNSIVITGILLSGGWPGLVQVLVIALLVVPGILLSVFRRWVRVCYRDKYGEPKSAWFFDGLLGGWAGDNQRLHESLYGVFFADENSKVERVLYAKRIQPVTRVCVDCGDYVVPTAENRCPDCDQPL